MGRLPNGKMLLFTEVFFTEWLNKKTKTKTKKNSTCIFVVGASRSCTKPKLGWTELPECRPHWPRPEPAHATARALSSRGHRPRRVPPPWEAGAGGVPCVRLEPLHSRTCRPGPCGVGAGRGRKAPSGSPGPGRAVSKQSTQRSGPGAVRTPGSVRAAPSAPPFKSEVNWEP